MSVESYKQRIRELAVFPVPPDFNWQCKQLDESIEQLKPGKWVNIYDYKDPATLLYVLAGWQEITEIEFDEYQLKFRKRCKQKATI